MTASAFITTIDDITRFHSAHEIEAYLGVVPSERSSGDRCQLGRITKVGNGRMRWLLGHTVSYRLVAQLLHAADCSLQANRTTREGPQHPDRDTQFQYLNDQVRRLQRQHRPAISVATKKKKERLGDFKNPGRAWRPKDNPEAVRVHDFLIKEQGQAVPYNDYDIARNEGWVSVDIDPGTAHFAVHAIPRWWHRMGRNAYPDTTALLITADAGGSNGALVRLWKWELQQFANRDELARQTARRSRDDREPHRRDNDRSWLTGTA